MSIAPPSGSLRNGPIDHGCPAANLHGAGVDVDSVEIELLEAVDEDRIDIEGIGTAGCVVELID